MEPRAASLLSFLGLGLLLLHYLFKLKYCDFLWMLIAGIVFTWGSFSVYHAIQKQPELRSNIILCRDYEITELNSFDRTCSLYYARYFLLSGICIGLYIGYNASVVYNIYYSKQMSIYLNIGLQSLISSVAILFVFLIENHSGYQQMFPFMYDNKPKWTVMKFLQSIWICIVVAEYMGITMTSGIMVLELLVSWGYSRFDPYYQQLFLGCLAVYCTCCCCCNCIRALVNRKQKELEEAKIQTI